MYFIPNYNYMKLYFYNFYPITTYLSTILDRLKTECHQKSFITGSQLRFIPSV